MKKIIVAAPPIPGETLPMLQIARGLAARGHQVTVLGGSAFRAAAEDSGLTFVPLTGAADYDIAELVAERERQGLPPGPPQLNFDWINAFVNPMADEHRALQELLAQDPDQYLVANALFLGALPAKLGAPGRSPLRWIGVSVVPLALSSDDTTFVGPVPVGPGEDQVAANRAGNAAFAGAFAPTHARLTEVLRELGADGDLPSFTDTIITLPDATAVLTVPGFEFHRSDLPENVHLVGMLPGGHSDGWTPPGWWPELDSPRPVVVVTQGTLANHDLSELIEPTLTGLAGQDVTVVAALGRDPAELSIPVPDNARAERFIPFDRLLPKADLLVTNGGAGGVHAALAAGVPVIVAGLTEDKPANGARVAFHRLGADLATGNPTPEAVADAVTAVLGDAEVRDNVKRLTGVYADHDALARIEDLLG